MATLKKWEARIVNGWHCSVLVEETFVNGRWEERILEVHRVKRVKRRIPIFRLVAWGIAIVFVWKVSAVMAALLFVGWLYSVSESANKIDAI